MLFPSHPRAEKVIRRVAAGITLGSGFFLLLLITSAEYQRLHFLYSLKWSALYWFIGMTVMFGEGLLVRQLKSDFTRLGLILVLWFSASYVLDSYVFYDPYFHMFSLERSERPQYFDILVFDYATTLSAIVWGMTATRASTIEPLMKALKMLMDPVKRFLKYERETRGIR